MDALGVVTLMAERLSTAVERVEGLGCLVLHARPLTAGVFAVDVRLTQAAANALAFAVADRRMSFARAARLCKLAS